MTAVASTPARSPAAAAPAQRSATSSGAFDDVLVSITPAGSDSARSSAPDSAVIEPESTLATAPIGGDSGETASAPTAKPKRKTDADVTVEAVLALLLIPSAGATPPVAADVEAGVSDGPQGSVVGAPPPSPAAVVQDDASALAAQASAAANAKTAALTVAGVTSITGESMAETPALQAPAAPKPPSPAAPAGAEDPDGGGEDAAASAAAAPVKDPNATPAASSANPDAAAPEAADAPTEKSGAAPAPSSEHRAVAHSTQTQTAAAPATPSAQNPQAAAGATAAVAAQVATEIAVRAGARRTRFEVRLDPGELGRVDVRLDIAHDGRISTRLIVERPDTLDMLRNDSRELTRTLENAGFQLGQGGLTFQLKQGGREAWGETAKAKRLAAQDEIDDIQPAVDVYRRSGPAGAAGVDMTV